MEHPTEGQGVSAIARRDPSTGKVTVNGRVTVIGAQPQTIDWIAAAPVTPRHQFCGFRAALPEPVYRDGGNAQ